MLLDVCLVNFNSIKVRLERMGFDIPVTNLPFQFHKGTIRTIDTFGVANAYTVISIP